MKSNYLLNKHSFCLSKTKCNDNKLTTVAKWRETCLLGLNSLRKHWNGCVFLLLCLHPQKGKTAMCFIRITSIRIGDDSMTNIRRTSILKSTCLVSFCVRAVFTGSVGWVTLFSCIYSKWEEERVWGVVIRLPWLLYFATDCRTTQRQREDQRQPSSRPKRRRRRLWNQEDQEGDEQKKKKESVSSHKFVLGLTFTQPDAGPEFPARLDLQEEVEDHHPGLHPLTSCREYEEEEPGGLQHVGFRGRVRATTSYLGEQLSEASTYGCQLQETPHHPRWRQQHLPQQVCYGTKYKLLNIVPQINIIMLVTKNLNV